LDIQNYKLVNFFEMWIKITQLEIGEQNYGFAKL